MNRDLRVISPKTVLLYLKWQQADVAFIQETHMTNDIWQTVKFKRDWVCQVFSSSFNSKKKGEAILLHQKLNFVLLKEHKDEERRMICLEIIINKVKINLCNMQYAPNQEYTDFFH